MVIKFGKWLTRHKAVVLIIAFLLLIPATIGYVSTRINYDLLSYLPNSLETVSGQDTMVDEFGMGAFSMIVVEDMEKKDIVALKEKLKKVNHVEDVIWYDDAMDITVPTEMLPDKLREGLFNGNATMMIALFDNTTSADSTMDAITEMRGIVKKQAFISGMSGVVTDIKNLAMAEMPIYVVVAAVLSLLILLLTMEHRMFKLTIILHLGYLHFHTWFQCEIILGSNHIIYQNHAVGKQRLYLATTDSRHFPHQKIHQLSGLRHIIYSISGNTSRLWPAGITILTS